MTRVYVCSPGKKDGKCWVLKSTGRRLVTRGVVQALPRDPFAARIGALLDFDREAVEALVFNAARLVVVQDVIREETTGAQRSKEHRA